MVEGGEITNTNYIPAASSCHSPTKNVKVSHPICKHQGYLQTSGFFMRASTFLKLPGFFCVKVKLDPGHMKVLAISEGITFN